MSFRYEPLPHYEAHSSTSVERGHGAPLERLTQLGDALCCVVASALVVEAAEMVVRQAAKVGSDSVNGR